MVSCAGLSGVQPVDEQPHRIGYAIEAATAGTQCLAVTNLARDIGAAGGIT
jgi:hypothetical protein